MRAEFCAEFPCRVALVHNPGAGDEKQPGRDALRAMIRAAGYRVRCCSSHDAGLAEFLRRPADLVAVAGGDGTVAKVAKIIHGYGVPIAVMPTGTANNIATSLGISKDKLDAQPRSWAKAAKINLDIGKAMGPWGIACFVEGFGLGLVPFGIRHAENSAALDPHDDAQDKVATAVSAIRQALHDCTAVRVRARLDGRDISGRYLMLQAMNIGRVGPNLNLAPRADPGDGRLDVVLVAEAQRELLDRYLAAHERDESRVPRLPVRRARRLHIEWRDFAVHIDDRLWPGKRRPRGRAGPIEITLYGHGVDFLFPATD